ncbi:hypothetical protein VNO78_05533 [Psophocarpus tetragonolobus]|uniref:Uncharacterized protein n=1 Tax=Psophocarpus tetragonolobus TaxID=3891 RepID=A0AAN9SRX6_PSOTE
MLNKEVSQYLEDNCVIGSDNDIVKFGSLEVQLEKHSEGVLVVGVGHAGSKKIHLRDPIGQALCQEMQMISKLIADEDVLGIGDEILEANTKASPVQLVENAFRSVLGKIQNVDELGVLVGASLSTTPP